MAATARGVIQCMSTSIKTLNKSVHTMGKIDVESRTEYEVGSFMLNLNIPKFKQRPCLRN